MKLKEFKKFLFNLPDTFDEFDVVNGEYGKFSGDEEYVYRIDRPISTIFVDEENNEICMLHELEKMDENPDKVF